MPKFKVRVSERVFYEPVIITADTEEKAEDIARQLQPDELIDDEGDEWEAEIEEADEGEIKMLTHIETRWEDLTEDEKGGDEE